MKQEVKNAIATVIGVFLVIIIVYFVTAIFLTKEIGSSNSNDNNTQSGLSLSYENVIIAGKVFSQKEDKYMVIFFSEKDSNESLKNYLSTYDSSKKDLKLYKVNLDEAINSFVKNEENNPKATKSSELKISGNTLMILNNGIIVSYIDDESQIIDILK